MPEYWYSALTKAGAVEEGTMAAADEQIIEERLRADGAYLIKAELRAAAARAPRTVTDGKVERRELLAFLEYVAGSFEVGIPILETLDDVPKRVQSKRLKKIIGEVRYAVAEEGKSLSAAFAEHPKAFAELYVGTIHAGEASGELGFALRQLVEYMDWQEGISGQLRQATMYPAIVLTAVGLLVIGLIAFVFPRLLPLLTMQKIALPLPTRVILATSLFIRTNWVLVIGIVVSLIAGTAVLRQTRRGRMAIDNAILRMPVFGEVVRDVNMARLVTYLGLFYRTGVELLLALSIVERIMQNQVVAHAIGSAREMIAEGVSMTAAFSKFPIFPNVVIRSLALGEATGNLDQSLTRAKDYYGREVPASVRRMITVLQPLLIVLLGGVILTVALAIVLPILNIYNSIGIRR